jgi:large subunit ribosomal protein L6
VIISTESDRKEHIALSGTFASHIKNMCRGVTEGFSYRMKVVYSHFPIQLKVSGNRLEINNFLGEKHPRYARIEEGVKITLGNDEITLEGTSKESLGSTASNIEHATKIRYRDPRVFQDGIYLTERA